MYSYFISINYPIEISTKIKRVICKKIKKINKLKGNDGKTINVE